MGGRTREGGAREGEGRIGIIYVLLVGCQRAANWLERGGRGRQSCIISGLQVTIGVRHYKMAWR